MSLYLILEIFLQVLCGSGVIDRWLGIIDSDAFCIYKNKIINVNVVIPNKFLFIYLTLYDI